MWGTWLGAATELAFYSCSLAQVDLEGATSALEDTKEKLRASRKAEAELAEELAALKAAKEARDAELKEQESTNAELMNMFSAVQAKLTKK